MLRRFSVEAFWRAPPKHSSLHARCFRPEGLQHDGKQGVQPISAGETPAGQPARRRRYLQAPRLQ